MAFKFNPFSGLLDIVGGGASSSFVNTTTSYANYSALVAAGVGTNTLNYVVASQGTKWLPGSLGGTYYPLGWYFYDGANYTYQETPFQATQATVNTGTNDDQFLTPLTFTNSSILASKSNSLTPVATKTSNYTANANELVPCDISIGSFTVTLPTAPIDGTRVQVKIIKDNSAYNLVIQTGTDDVLNIAGGITKMYMNLDLDDVQLQYQASTKVWFATATAAPWNFATNNPGIDATTPINNTNISIDYTTRILTVAVPPTYGYFNVFTDGNGIINKYRKDVDVAFPAFTDNSGWWYFYWNSLGVAVTTQTPWLTSEFNQIAPVYRLYWNATLWNFTFTTTYNATAGTTYTVDGNTYTVLNNIIAGSSGILTGTVAPPSSGTLTKTGGGAGDASIIYSSFSSSEKSVIEQVEYHPNTLSADGHQFFHLQGTQWMSGFDMINNALTSGSPNANGANTVIGLTTGTNLDDNLKYTVTNCNPATATSPWTQDMGSINAGTLTSSNSGMFRISCQNASAIIVTYPETRFPFSWDGVTNIPNYITSTGVKTPVSNGYFFVYFVYAYAGPRPGKAVNIISATSQFSSLANAKAYNWIDMQTAIPFFNDGDIRPLYRLVFEYKTSYDAAVKYSVLRETQDIRKAAITSTTTASGSLPASSVTHVPTGTNIETNVQSVLDGIDTRKVAGSGVSGQGAYWNGTNSVTGDAFWAVDAVNKKHTISQINLIQTRATGLELTNTTPATVSVKNQDSPSFVLGGNSWGTTASQSWPMMVRLTATSTSYGTGQSTLRFETSQDGAYSGNYGTFAGGIFSGQLFVASQYGSFTSARSGAASFNPALTNISAALYGYNQGTVSAAIKIQDAPGIDFSSRLWNGSVGRSHKWCVRTTGVADTENNNLTFWYSYDGGTNVKKIFEIQGTYGISAANKFFLTEGSGGTSPNLSMISTGKSTSIGANASNSYLVADNSAPFILGGDTTANIVAGVSSPTSWLTISSTLATFSGQIKTLTISAALTDGVPTATELDSATGLTASTAGTGYQAIIKDTSGTGLMYKIYSDGTDWYYSVTTKAV
jgi:hypothetical protein